MSQHPPASQGQQYPDPITPLPAWRHYQIVKYTEEKVKLRLKQTDFEGYIISLGVAYTVYEADDETQTWNKMNFGPDFGIWPEGLDEYTTPREITTNNEPETENMPITLSPPLDDEFMTELHEEVYALVNENLTHHSDVDVIVVAAAMDGNGAITIGTKTCIYCTTHASHKDTNPRRKYKHEWDGRKWVCQSSTCRC